MIHSRGEGLELPDYDRFLAKKDFFPKIFLIPQEVRLDKQKGLVVIKRSEQRPDKFQQQDVQDIQIDPNKLSKQQGQNRPGGHGLLSLFKKTSSRKIRLAICVCVYSQPKHMLKNTIKGIQESYKHFFQKAGIMSHQIILICIFDGIQKVNNSKDQTQNMISYFNQFDFKNGFRLQPYSKSVEDYVKQMSKDVENYQDISVFTQRELQQLKGKLFETQYNEYTRIRKLLEVIKELKKNKQIKIDNLPQQVYKKYEDLCLNYCIENNITIASTKEQIQEYLSTKREVRMKLILEAIKEKQELCVRYLESRQDKAILYPVRLNNYEQELQEVRKVHHPLPQTQTADKQSQYDYMFFCVKHKNGGKLSSHLLFFEGFCKTFDPQFCILLDVGLKPQKDAIYKMWSYMEKNPRCGGVCGYMGLKVENPADDLGYRQDGFELAELDGLTKLADLVVDLQKAQQFEYHYAHMLDKPFEAAFNYIHVLPGAFSGYRWKALKSISYGQPDSTSSQIQHEDLQSERPMNCVQAQNLLQSKEQDTIMKKYLKTAMSDKYNLSLEESNMYLAEDRIMCLGIHALGYHLAYLPDAQSLVDPITSLTRMMGQRRRWINGSWFAFKYVFSHRDQRTSCLFLFQLMYYQLVQFVTYISLSLFYISLNLTVTAAVREYVVPAILRFFKAQATWELSHYKIGIFDVDSVSRSLPHIVNFVYLICVGGLFFLSINLNQNNKLFSKYYYLISSLLGFYGVAMLVLLIYNTCQIIFQIAAHSLLNDFIIPPLYYKILILSVIGGHALPILWTFSLSKYFQMISSCLSYLFYVPTYLHILIIYSFCRIDDLSWGTKGLDDDVQRAKAQDWKVEKFKFVGKYLFTNALIAYVVMEVISFQVVKNVVILAFTILIVFLLLFRLVFAALYLIKYGFKKMCNMGFAAETISENIHRGSQVLAGLRTIESRIKQIEKLQTQRKKEQQFKELSNSRIFQSLALSNIGAKLRKRITQHIIDNNVIPKKEMSLQRKKFRSKRVQFKKLNVIQELSNESQSNTNTILQNSFNSNIFQKEKSLQRCESQTPSETLLVPEVQYSSQNAVGHQLKSRIERLKRNRQQRKNYENISRQQ